MDVSARLQFQSIRHRTEFFFDGVMKYEKQTTQGSTTVPLISLFTCGKSCFKDVLDLFSSFGMQKTIHVHIVETFELFRFEEDSVNLIRIE